MTRFFVTATGTDVGKTMLTATLAWQLRQQGKNIAAVKPLISGWVDDPDKNDTLSILQSLDMALTEENIASISPWRFKTPVSPNLAAHRENRVLNYEEIRAFSRKAMEAPAEYVLIEGVGGLMSPVTDEHTCVEWIKELDIPVILVAGSYIGSISHTLTAVEVLKLAKIPIQSIIVSESLDSQATLAETCEIISSFTKKNIASLPRVTQSRHPWKNAQDITFLLSKNRNNDV